jgi:putative nucleotidyltransferase with HDIG domain
MHEGRKPVETTVRGNLILNSVPVGEIEQKVTEFLLQYYKNTPREKIGAMVRKVPVVLSRNVSRALGHAIVSGLNELGASASFVPKNGKPSQLEESVNASPDGAQIASKHQGVLQSIQDYHTSMNSKPAAGSRLRTRIEAVNKELWLILSMLGIVGLMNYLLVANQMLLGLYTLPTILSAYFYGRRHATLTAIASILLVGLVAFFNPRILNDTSSSMPTYGKWFEFASWGGILVITAYAMGSLYEKNIQRLAELRRTYQGVIVILRHFISKDKYTENHCYRVSIYATRIAGYLGFRHERLEDIRTAALLHDIGKLDISREILYKASHLSPEEFDRMKQHVNKGTNLMDSLSGSLGRVIPIILSHHEKYDGTGYHGMPDTTIPLEARIISVADVYDALISDRPYRKGMSPFEAKEIIEKGSGSDFDPSVVDAFLKAFHKQEMDVPDVIV